MIVHTPLSFRNYQMEGQTSISKKRFGLVKGKIYLITKQYKTKKKKKKNNCGKIISVNGAV